MKKFFQRTKHLWLIVFFGIATVYYDVTQILAPISEENNAKVSCMLVHVYPAVNVQSGKSSFEFKQAADYKCGDTIVQNWVDPYRPPTEMYGMYSLSQRDINEIDGGYEFAGFMYAFLMSICCFAAMCMIIFGGSDESEGCDW
jgi:hypothetical protein